MGIIVTIPSTLILFVAVLLMALTDRAGNGILANFGTITTLTIIVSVGMAIWRTHRYRKHRISAGTTLAAFVFSLVSEVAGSLYILLCVRDIAVVAATGGLVFNLLGVILSLPLAILSIAIVKAPSFFATAIDDEPMFAIIDGIVTVVLAAIACSIFGFSLSQLF